jgi:hypothetical protein
MPARAPPNIIANTRSKISRSFIVDELSVILVADKGWLHFDLAVGLTWSLGCYLSCGGDRRLLRERRSSIVNQALQPMRCHVQGGVIHRALVPFSGFGPLRFQDVVDFLLDF